MSSKTYPPGCFMRSGNSLVYNTVVTSTSLCTSDSLDVDAFCLCISAPDCTHTNGATSNDAPCLCDGTHKQGGTGCTEASGLFCYASDTYGHCSKAPHPIVQLIRLGIGLSIVIFVYYTYRIWNFKRSSNSRTSSTTSHDQQI